MKLKTTISKSHKCSMNTELRNSYHIKYINLSYYFNKTLYSEYKFGAC